jgi:hypothetical protein
MGVTIPLQTLACRVEETKTDKEPGSLETIAREFWGRDQCPHQEERDAERCRTRPVCTCESVAFVLNGPQTSHVVGGFYHAFVRAYNDHAGLSLSPDDIWLQILLFVSEYMDTPESAKQVLGENKLPESKRVLTVTTRVEAGEDQWNEFFQSIAAMIQEYTVPGYVELLAAPFSTTTAFGRNMLTIGLMSANKQHFEYGRIIPRCGITSVHLQGTLQDWQNIRQRAVALERLDRDSKLLAFLRPLHPILEQFEATYLGKPDVAWWNQVCHFESGRLGSGTTTLLSGWLLAFYGLAGKTVDVDDIPERRLQADVEIDNKLTGRVSTKRILAGFAGIHYANGVYRPRQCISVLHVGVPAQYTTPCDGGCYSCAEQFP